MLESILYAMLVLGITGLLYGIFIGFWALMEWIMKQMMEKIPSFGKWIEKIS